MLELTVNERTFQVLQDEDRMVIDGVAADWDACTQPGGLISVLYNGKSYTAILENTDRKNKEVTIRVNGRVFKISIKEPIDLLLTNLGLDQRASKKAEPVKAPMPGMVLKILVTPGQQIQKGDGLVILEAMKMENILKASGPAVVKSIKVAERTAVEKGTVLIEMV